MIKKEYKYEGHEMIGFWENEDDKFPKFSCGVKKAQVIVEHFADIKAFVEKHGEVSVKSKKAGNG